MVDEALYELPRLRDAALQGEVVEAQAPAGTIKFEILEISF